MYQTRRKEESGRGSARPHDPKCKKRAYRCMDELNDSDSDDDYDQEGVPSNSNTCITQNMSTFVYTTVPSQEPTHTVVHADVKSEPYADVKTEPV
jgi:hypothetical protein